MADEGSFFLRVQNGDVWACWLDARAPVKLGSVDEVVSAMHEFAAQLEGKSTAAPQPPAPEPAPAPAEPPLATPAPPQRPVGGAPAPEPAPRTAAEQKDRREQRHDISIIGRVRTGSGARDVTVRDLSESGCRFYDPLSPMPPGQNLTIKLGPIGPIDAVVRWRREDDVGIEFLNPLYPSVLDHIRQHFDLRR